MFCEYSNIFGKPNEGLHSIRLFDIAIIDVILTIMAAYLLNIMLNGNNFILILIVLFISGIILHRLFCVRTTVDKYLFGSK
jgi:hypothetical protein